MSTPAPRVSLADLSAAGLRLRPAEAVAVARALMLRASRGELPGIPSAHVVRLLGDGAIQIEGPVAAGKSVERAARLLDSMLPGFDAPPEFRVPGALRLVLARALGTLDLPAYSTLDEFAEALVRFAAPDVQAAVRDVVGVWVAAVAREDAPQRAEVSESAHADVEVLTISDVRRARRATGVTLTQVSERSRVPVSLLRELEWGFYTNWPAGHYGRTQLARYARASGLDEKVVVNAVLPDIEAWHTSRHATGADSIVDTTVLPEPAPTALVKTTPALPVPFTRAARRNRWRAALAIPALLAIGLVPAMWNATQNSSNAEVAVPADVSRPADPVPSASRPAQEPPRGVATSGERRAQPDAPVPSRRDVELTDARPAALRADAAFSPAFASVGSAMFYHSEEDRGSAIMRADTDGSGAVLRITSIVNDNAQNFHARPSPDGRFIAFDSDRDGERAVYIADARGHNVRRVTGEGFAAVPSWSPDGRTLAYVRAEDSNPKVWNLWIVDVSTGDTRRLTAHRVGQPWGGAWFPDGRRIAYSHENRLVVRPLDGGTPRAYAAPTKRGWIRTPAVSPDGNRIIFQVHREGAWLLDLRDGSMRKVLSDPTAEEFTWSPDGRRLAYHSRKTGKWGVWIMAAR